MTTTGTFVPKTITADGLEITYYDSENEREHPGEAIVLVHGTSGTAPTHFGFLYPILSTKYRVIGFDWANPTTGDQPLELEDLVAQTAEVIRQVAPNTKVTLVGFSLGAVTAAATAARHQDLIGNLVLIAGWARTDYVQKLRNRVYNTLAAQEDPSALRAWTMFSAYSPDFLLMQSPQALDKAQETIVKTEFSHKQMELNTRIDIFDELGNITAPTLIISAQEDIMIPPHHQRQLFGGIDNARLTRVNSGHMCVNERAPELVHHILEFTEKPERFEAGSIIPTPKP
ncbi:alpha/beta hydrolase [Corynebacterium sp. 732RC1]|nr:MULTISPECIES: alpha/beta hydrolase [unclassified Corynebacterium]MCQ9343006.1 alpha/beta hydrolase [Corynebacterium sp. 76QC2CO]MCQ9363683.1 alpha/beta hydrolase [Corynebacterium sp. 732RC1]MCQ9370483.1 alpha/beta hydrolase [Corynebacterium sp. 35RC1]